MSDSYLKSLGAALFQLTPHAHANVVDSHIEAPEVGAGGFGNAAHGGGAGHGGYATPNLLSHSIEIGLRVSGQHEADPGFSSSLGSGQAIAAGSTSDNDYLLVEWLEFDGHLREWKREKEQVIPDFPLRATRPHGIK